MSKENVQRFITRVAQDYSLAARLKAIPAGPGAEAAFVSLANEQGLDFTVEELREEADKSAAVGPGASDPSGQGESAQWVLDYFYGADRKWTT